jgi:hypothetical protein
MTLPSAGFTSANSLFPATNCPSMKFRMDFNGTNPAAS